MPKPKFINFLCVIILLSLILQGMGQCTLKDMSIQQIKLHKLAKNINGRPTKPLWNVTISNNCYCSQSNVRIGCMGIGTSKQANVDPSIAKIAKGKGLVNKGEPIYPYTSIGFITYASIVPFQFKLLSSQVACS